MPLSKNNCNFVMFYKVRIIVIYEKITVTRLLRKVGLIRMSIFLKDAYVITLYEL